MSSQKHTKMTKLSIVKVAFKMFLEKGYADTTPGAICRELGISLGTLTYHFDKKEDLFSVFIQLLADFQWKIFREQEEDGETPIMALCLELTAMAAMCEENKVAKDLYLNAYMNPKSLSIIRNSDMLRAKKVFADFCPDWTDENYAQAEMLVSGIEYATLQLTPDVPSLETRITGAMNTILSIYNVPEERRKIKIEKALNRDYRRFGQQIFLEFQEYVSQTLEQTRIDMVMQQYNELLEKLYRNQNYS